MKQENIKQILPFFSETAVICGMVVMDVILATAARADIPSDKVESITNSDSDVDQGSQQGMNTH